MKCHCCSGKAFKDCCQPVIKDCNAAHPEQLMRSRFSAYVIRNYEYVLGTYSPQQRKHLSLQDLSDSAVGTKWCSLEIITSSMNGNDGSVEFIATYAIDAEFFSMHEISSFEKQGSNWYYTTGVAGTRSGKLTPSRNDKCPCGSGKKFKKCCHI